MAISRVKTWIAGEVLTASDLNAEVNNIINNPVDLWSPAAKAADMNGFELILDGDADTSITADTDDQIDFRASAIDWFRMIGTASSGIFYVNDSSNANQTVGITVNQGGNDDEAVSLKSSDVAHGVTTVTETDTYLRILKAQGAAGGVFFEALTDANAGNANVVQIFGTSGIAADTTKSTAGRGVVEVNTAEISGASRTSVTANGNLLAVRANDTTRFMLDADGDSHQDVGTAWMNFDAHDDVALLNTAAALLGPDTLKGSFTQGFLMENRAHLERLGIVTFNEDGHHFINWSRFHMLHMGATRYLAEQITKLNEAIQKCLPRP